MALWRENFCVWTTKENFFYSTGNFKIWILPSLSSLESKIDVVFLFFSVLKIHSITRENYLQISCGFQTAISFSSWAILTRNIRVFSYDLKTVYLNWKKTNRKQKMQQVWPKAERIMREEWINVFLLYGSCVLLEKKMRGTVWGEQAKRRRKIKEEKITWHCTHKIFDYRFCSFLSAFCFEFAKTRSK